MEVQLIAGLEVFDMEAVVVRICHHEIPGCIPSSFSSFDCSSLGTGNLKLILIPSATDQPAAPPQ